MTKVDFYLLAQSGQDVREAMACKLIEKIAFKIKSLILMVVILQ